ncbi:MAG: hypothetical protein CVU52_03215 [Deltaproteobacteria bacterium HGW-Deltaproteobacteria-10]|nr:MAG: hypothetical protein CVU52_03215 [Deltaproteobacteria bacterium HGW-Deltaproteobacteria-10]
MAISSITTNQANAAPHVQIAQKTSGAKAYISIQTASVNRNADTVTISQQALKYSVKSANEELSVKTAQNLSETDVNNAEESSGNRNSDTEAFFPLAHKIAVQAAKDAKDAAASRAAKASQAAAAALADAAEQNINGAQDAEPEQYSKAAQAAAVALAVAAAQNAKAALAIAAAQAANAERNAANT